MKEREKIDFVITWVDGNDKEWRAERESYLQCLMEEELRRNAAARYRDMGLLKYWFRGVEQFAPWVNRIHFVTCGQKPEWLNINHPKLHLVRHCDYMPEECLPTFNSNAIELGLHRIPELSEQFVYFNDDVFLTDAVDGRVFFRKGLPCDMYEVKALISFAYEDAVDYIRLNDIGVLNKHFFGRKSKLCAFFKKYSIRYDMKTNLRNLYSIGWKGYVGISDPHITVAYRKSEFEKLWQTEGRLMQETCGHRFRTPYDLSHWAIRYCRLAAGRFSPVNIYHNMHCFTLRDGDLTPCEAIKTQRYKAVCLNDNFSVKNFKQIQGELQKAFEAILPKKSSFEL